MSSSSAIRVEFTGTVVAVNGQMIDVDVNGDVRTVIIDENTDLTRGGHDRNAPLSPADIVAGQRVEIHGRLQPDNTILATRFHLEDEDEGLEPVATATMAQPPDDDIEDDADEDDRDNRGPGNAEDQDDADDDDRDNSGPGNAEDDDRDNSGPGSGDDDHDNSGPGGGDDSDGGGSGSNGG